jgi:hypothetical protein
VLLFDDPDTVRGGGAVMAQPGSSVGATNIGRTHCSTSAKFLEACSTNLYFIGPFMARVPTMRTDSKAI